VIGDSDVVLLLIDASAGVPEFGEDVMELLDRAPRLLVVRQQGGRGGRAAARAGAGVEAAGASTWSPSRSPR
jgi:hypothetical protein